jgi:predicted N-formylglutamate amidohydrolase
MRQPTGHDQALDGKAAQVIRPAGHGPVVLVCEHASNHIPAAFGALGLSPEDLSRHIAWDPGALPVATALAAALDAPLVAGTLSRLLFDCNRPPEAPDAIPARSEIFDIPGNRDLTPPQRADRVRLIHDPFRATLCALLDQAHPRALVTVHSFTPVYHGQPRAVEIGLLHDADSRLADAMLDCAAHHSAAQVQRNAPYGPQDGVTHTLRAHALPRGLLNVMLELRNDLIATPAQQQAVAAMLAGWITAALQRLTSPEEATCTR